MAQVTHSSKTNSSTAKVHMSVSNSKPSSCKTDTSKLSASKTNPSIAKVHMSVSNSNTSKPSSCKTDTSKPSTSKTNASVAKVHMPTSANQTHAWTCNNPSLERPIEQGGAAQGEKLSITVSFWPLISRSFLFSFGIKFGFDTFLSTFQSHILGMSVLVVVVILSQHLCVHPVEVGNDQKRQQSKTKLDLEQNLSCFSVISGLCSIQFTFISDCQKLTVEEKHGSSFYRWLAQTLGAVTFPPLLLWQWPTCDMCVLDQRCLYAGRVKSPNVGVDKYTPALDQN